MNPIQTISATEFKTRCLELLDQLALRKLHRLSVTKRGRVVAVLHPPDDEHRAASAHGFMRGSVTIPEGFDLTTPAVDIELNAEFGRVHE